MNIKLADLETIETSTCFYVVLVNSLVVVPCGALDSDLCLQLFATTEEAGFLNREFFSSFFLFFFLILQGHEKMEKIFRILLGNILKHTQDKKLMENQNIVS